MPRERGECVMEKMKDIAYYNGTVTRIADMMIPAGDRGFYFGDGIYEVAMVFHRKIFALEEHLDRMERSAARTRIELPVTRQEMGTLLQELADRVESDCQFLYWQITRGTAPRSHPFPAGAAGNLYVYSKPWPGVEMSDDYRLVSATDTRSLNCDSKTLNLLLNVLAAQTAKENGCQEAVFVRDGIVTEGSHSNVSMIRDGVFITHPADNLILPGIERKHLIAYCARLGIPVEERAFTLEELKGADEILVSSTSHPSMRVREIDGVAVGMKDAAAVEKLRKMYLDEVEKCGRQAANAGLRAIRQQTYERQTGTCRKRGSGITELRSGA